MKANRFTLFFLSICCALQADSPNKGTEILWDKFGVAHVYAKCTADLFYCYGRAQAQSHGNLLLNLYGESRGRAAEYFLTAGLANDKWGWTNGVPQRSARMLAKQTPEFRGYLEAFANGINDYAAQNPGALLEQAGISRSRYAGDGRLRRSAH